MKPVKIDNVLAYYIKEIDGSILIVEENRHFLDCPYTLWENIMPLIKDIDKEKIPIYIARPHFSKKKYTYHRADFLKSKENIDVHSGKDLSFEELPEKLKERIKSIQEKLTHLRLVNEEIQHLKQVIEKDKEMIQKYPKDFALKFSLHQLEGRLEELYKEKEEVEKSLEEM
ncbi:hypothetical protein [Persephonella sp. KM09-Lau-8]|uniref:hypothetical protein n=1 Tax=Persephonella sp. KM09-Lau-8 TaxID=1158345 RepID=UPI000497375A|nr:hypothetical protein [Persephonella sp. KM09-Lau-8]